MEIPKDRYFQPCVWQKCGLRSLLTDLRGSQFLLGYPFESRGGIVH
jgi:hypothetical protein